DFNALYQFAGDVDELKNRTEDKDLLARLRDAAARGRALAAPSAGQDAAAGRSGPRLFLDPGGTVVVPDFMTPQVSQQNNKVGVRDLWDRGPSFQLGRYGPIKLPWMLLAVVGLLSAEWLTRKLLRLA